LKEPIRMNHKASFHASYRSRSSTDVFWLVPLFDLELEGMHVGGGTRAVPANCFPKEPTNDARKMNLAILDWDSNSTG
jgi:hypothetical protein